METIKKGDTARCISENGWILFDQKPQVGSEYKVIDTDGNYLILEGFQHETHFDMWHSRNFEKVKSLTEILAETFFGSLIEERPEYERVFCLDASF